MRKRLSAVGNSLGIIIEKPILELLYIDETELELSTNGERLILEPIRLDGHRLRVTASQAGARFPQEAPRQARQVTEPEFLKW